MDGSIEIRYPLAFMQGVAIRIGGKDASAMRTIENEMAGGLLNDTTTGGYEIVAIEEVGMKGNVAEAGE
jgi:hypothetical protein